MSSAQPNARVQALLDQFAAACAGQPSRYELPFQEARAQLLRERQPWLDDGPECEVEDRRVESAGRQFRIQVVGPRNRKAGRLLVYIHGGGWCVGSPETHGPVVRRLAEALECEAWSVDYALAPEAPFPGGLLDCEAAIDFARREYPHAELVVGGDSAGANLAVGAALRLRDRDKRLPEALLLFYGVYTDSCRGASMDAYGDGRYGLSIMAHQRYMAAYGGENGPAPDDAGYAYPLRAGVELNGLPRSYLMAAQIDILRDQSHAFAAALRAAQVDVALDEVEGVTHGFLAYGKVLPEVGTGVARAAQFVNR